MEALLDQSRRVPNLKNRVDPAVEKAVLEYAVEDPAHGQARVSNELRKQGKKCDGRTPIETLIDGKEIWKEKFIA